MKKNECGTGHGMPAPVSSEVTKRTAEAEKAKRKQQAENFAKDSLPTKASTTTTIHESKHFPFQVVEITTTNNETGEKKQTFKIGVGGAFMSEKEFDTMEKCNKYIAYRPWELITNLMCYTIQNAIEYEKTVK